MDMNDSRPLISIIVPIYNVEDYLDRCILTIINQTYTNTEIILVDDGSTDHSGTICDKYAKKEKKIQVIHQKNQGLVRARKAGLEAAKGDYIGFVDGDDYIEPNMYCELMDKLRKSKADFIHSGYYAGDENRRMKPFMDGIYRFTEINKLDFICQNVLNTSQKNSMSISPSIWSKLFGAELIKKAYSYVPDSQSLGEDIISLCVCLLEADAIVLTTEAYYHYTIRENSLVHCADSIQMVRYTQLYHSLCNVFAQYGQYDRIRKDLNVYMVQLCVLFLRQACKDTIYMEQYRFPEPDILRDKKIVLYGAGTVGENYYSYFKRTGWCDVVGWIDQSYSERNSVYEMVEGADALDKMEYDLIIVAVKREELSNEIIRMLRAKGIREEKIVWRVPYDMVIGEN